MRSSRRRTVRSTPPLPRTWPGEIDHKNNLANLYEISKLLMRFDDVGEIVPRVLDVIHRGVPLRTAILLEESDPGTLWARLWHAGNVSEGERRAAEVNAKTVYAYLSGTKQEQLAGIDFPHVRLDALAPTAQPPRAPPAHEKSFMVLPLASDRGAIFGVVLVESAAVLEEPDLAFVSAATNQLAVALDRQRSLRREVSLRERAEALERMEKDALSKAWTASNRLAFLADLSVTLASSLDYAETLRKLARASVPILGEWCVVDMVEGERLVRLGSAHRDAAHEPLLEEIGAFHADMQLEHGPSRVARTGELEVVASITDEFMERLASIPVYHEHFTRLEVSSFLSIPLESHGKVLGVVSFGRRRGERPYDTEDVVLARELCSRAAVAVENARLYADSKKAVRLRDQFLAVVSHDLRNPLGAIDLTVSLMLRSLPATDAKARQRAENIRRSAHRMNRLIDDLLDMASIDANRLAVDMKRHDVKAILAEAVDAMTDLTQEKHLHFETVIAPGVGDVSCDRFRILQVFSNLVGNAIKFTPAGGSIVLRAEPEAGAVRFSVADTGRGMSAPEVEHAFERFWQAQMAGRTGIGLGLFIARGIVEAHSGRIWVESQPNRGTTFFFTLPALDAPRSL